MVIAEFWAQLLLRKLILRVETEGIDQSEPNCNKLFNYMEGAKVPEFIATTSIRAWEPVVLQLCGGRISLSCSECCCNFLTCHEKVTSWSLAGAPRLNRSPTLLRACRWASQLSSSTTVRPPLAELPCMQEIRYMTSTRISFSDSQVPGQSGRKSNNQIVIPLSFVLNYFTLCNPVLFIKLHIHQDSISWAFWHFESKLSVLHGGYVYPCAYICMQLSCLWTVLDR